VSKLRRGVFRTIKRNPGIYADDIANLLDESIVTVAAITDDLLDQGFIEVAGKGFIDKEQIAVCRDG